MLDSVRSEVYSCVPYVPGKTTDDLLDELGLTDRSAVVKLGSNENPFGPFPTAKQRMLAAIEVIERYPESDFVRLKQLLGERNGVSEHAVALGHGAGGVLDTIAKVFIAPGDEVVMVRQSYRLYREISVGMGAEVREVDLDDQFTMDLDRVAAAVTPATKLVWLCNPNNPTGTVFDPARLNAFLDGLPERTWVVMDEAYAEFADPAVLPDTLGLIRAGRQVIKVGTFSKYYGLAGGRIGYLIADPDVVTAYDTISEPFNANAVGLAGAVGVLTGDQEATTAAGQSICAERDRIIGRLRDLGCAPEPAHTNFVFFGTDYPASEVDQLLLERGVITRPCGWWGYPHHLRVTVGTRQDNDTFLEALVGVLATLRSRA